MARSFHIVGAGLAGLSAATCLAEAGEKVVVHEATSHPGGRCRSYRDPVLKMPIDNGNHMIVSGNRSALSYLKRIGAEDRVCGPESAQYLFVDLETRERWTLELGNGSLPWWIFSVSHRVPNTHPSEYLSWARLVWYSGARSVGDVVPCAGPVYERLLYPLLLATLNNEPRKASAKLAARLMRETSLLGGRNCRPLIARSGLSDAFVDPAVAYLQNRGAEIKYHQELRNLSFDGHRLAALEFSSGRVELGPDDVAIIAVPPAAAGRLMPDLETPSQHCAIANIHFRLDKQVDLPAITGVLHGLTQWIFSFPGRIAVTISNANTLPAMSREDLARRVWTEVATVAGLREEMPAWQVVWERRATYATFPEEEAKRPATKTAWRNLLIAGDWTATGLPPTIEGAIRSGQEAAHQATTLKH